MKLYELAEQEVDDIVDEWVQFARTILPASRGLSHQSLANHAKALLLSLAADMRRTQGGQAQYDKSQGRLPGNSPEISRAAAEHARERFIQGFTLDQMVSEYRALRASVIRRWTEQLGRVDRATMEELTRFGETMDQGLTESIALYSTKLEESRSLLLGVLGHDLRNPLAVVQMSADYLHRSAALNEAQGKVLARIVTSTARMQEIVDDVLDFTRTALAGALLPMCPHAADMGDLCRGIVAELQALHPRHKIDVECSGELTGVWDSARLGQLLSNLIANAIQHGRRDAPVVVAVTDDAENVTVRVHNEGPPIPADALRNLFEPLRQAPDQHKAGSSGLGLGLYIAREIAVAHGGDITVSSAQREGTTFSVRLPRTPRAAAVDGAVTRR